MSAPFQLDKDEDLLLEAVVKWAQKGAPSAAISEKNTAGRLILSSKRLVWLRNGYSTPQVSIALVNIKEVKTQTGSNVYLKIVPVNAKSEKAGYVFDFNGPNGISERDSFKTFLSRLLPKVRRRQEQLQNAQLSEQKIVPAPASSSSSSISFGGEKELIGLAEAKQRAALLASDKNLKALHDELVGSGAVSEIEFWEQRSQMLADERQAAPNQLKGVPSSLIADLQPTIQSNTVFYTLTPQIIHQIFAEYPGVQDAYRTNVPDKMTEKDFWEKYLRSQYFHRDRVKGNTINVSEKDIFGHCAEEDEKAFVPPKKKPKNLDPLVDITGDSTLPDGYGTAEHKKEEKLEKSLGLIRKFNRHGQIVLGPQNEKEVREPEKIHARIQSQVKLRELSDEEKAKTIPLKIQDQRRYFEGHSTSSSSTSLKRKAPDSTNHVNNNGKSTNNKSTSNNSHNDVMSNSHMTSIFHHEFANAQTSLPLAETKVPESQAWDIMGILGHTSLTHSNYGKKAEKVKVPEELLKRLFNHYATANELLRHYWGSYPVISTEAAEKIARVVKSMEKLDASIKKTIENNKESDDVKSEMRRIMQPLFDSFAAVHSQERSSKS